jgi:hypothetical protein
MCSSTEAARRPTLPTQARVASRRAVAVRLDPFRLRSIGPHRPRGILLHHLPEAAVVRLVEPPAPRVVQLDPVEREVAGGVLAARPASQHKRPPAPRQRQHDLARRHDGGDVEREPPGLRRRPGTHRFRRGGAGTARSSTPARSASSKGTDRRSSSRITW